MKRTIILLLFVLGCLPAFRINAQEYEAQGTTVKKEKDGCTFTIVIQVGIDSAREGQFDTIRNALMGCFNKECAIPCPDGKGKGCKIIAAVLVKKWESIAVGDRAKFHYVHLISPGAKYSSSALVTPNGGGSGKANWRYPEYDNKVYCHEVLHLSGLDDKYCDCTIMNDSAHHGRYMEYGHRCEPPPDPNGTLCCLVNQTVGQRRTYPCEGHESDIMSQVTGNDVGCINYLGILEAAGMTCSAECCKTEEHHSSLPESFRTAKFGLTIAADIGVGIFKEKVASGVIRNIGPAVSLTTSVNNTINDVFTIAAGLKFMYDHLSASKKSSQAPAPGYTNEQEEHFAYKYASLYLDMYIYWRFAHQYIAMFGPQIGAFILARNRYQAVYTTTLPNGSSYSQEYGNDSFTPITASKNVQLAVNVGVGRDIKLGGLSFTPYILYRQPITNVWHSTTRNALSAISLGALWHLH